MARARSWLARAVGAVTMSWSTSTPGKPPADRGVVGQALAGPAQHGVGRDGAGFGVDGHVTEGVARPERIPGERLYEDFGGRAEAVRAGHDVHQTSDCAGDGCRGPPATNRAGTAGPGPTRHQHHPRSVRTSVALASSRDEAPVGGSEPAACGRGTQAAECARLVAPEPSTYHPPVASVPGGQSNGLDPPSGGAGPAGPRCPLR